MLSLNRALLRRLLFVGLASAVFGCSADASSSEENVTDAIHHEFSFRDVRISKLMVGLPGEYFYAHTPIPCGLAVGSGPNVTSIKLAGNTAPGSNLKVELYAGTKVCRTMFFRATRFATTYYSHQVYLESSDAGTLSASGATPILFLDGTDTGNTYELSLDLGNLRDKGSSKFVGVRGDVTVKATGKTPAPWSNKQTMSFAN